MRTRGYEASSVRNDRLLQQTSATKEVFITDRLSALRRDRGASEEERQRAVTGQVEFDERYDKE